jgi:organic radical activating enzyme
MNDKFPIAETFHSIQGEGTFVGTPMHFVRLAGCSVGKPASTMLRTSAQGTEAFPILGSGKPAWACQTYDGRNFWCDTDFAKYSEATVEELLNDTWENHICLTGGEPLIHLKQFCRTNFFTKCRNAGKVVHLETSGTIVADLRVFNVWVTVAPKFGFLDEMLELADEIKILVDAKFHPDNLPPVVLQHPNVFLCPVNYLVEVDQTNVERCMFWLKRFPGWKMSFQAHKLLGMR